MVQTFDYSALRAGFLSCAKFVLCCARVCVCVFFSDNVWNCGTEREKLSSAICGGDGAFCSRFMGQTFNTLLIWVSALWGAEEMSGRRFSCDRARSADIVGGGGDKKAQLLKFCICGAVTCINWSLNEFANTNAITFFSLNRFPGFQITFRHFLLLKQLHVCANSWLYWPGKNELWMVRRLGKKLQCSLISWIANIPHSVCRSKKLL